MKEPRFYVKLYFWPMHKEVEVIADFYPVDEKNEKAHWACSIGLYKYTGATLEDLLTNIRHKWWNKNE